MEFRVLGKLEVVSGGVSLDLGGRAQRAVLAILVLNANRVVSLDRFVDDLWPSGPPAGATGTLQAYISRLRRLLEPDRPPGTRASVLLTHDPGYVLRVDPEQVDAVRFDRLVEEGRVRLSGGDPETARRLLGEALALWRGPALADLAAEPFAAADVTRLEERRLAAIEDRFEACLAVGLHSSVVAELEVLARAHPWRERLTGQLVLALYRSGRQADALRAYQGTRRLLAEELGIDPGPALKALEQAVLLQAPELDWRPSTAPGAVVGTGPADPPSGLPTGTVTFLLADVEGASRLWEEHPDAAQAVLARFATLAAEAVGRHGGVVAPNETDAVLGAFASAPDALAAAIDLQLALRVQPSPESLAISARVALHTGEAVIEGGRYHGLAMHRTGGLRDLVHGGQTVLSGVTAELVRDRLPAGGSLRHLGAYRLEGVERPEEVFQVCHLELGSEFPPLRRPAVPPHNLPVRLTSFVGREREVPEVAKLVEFERLVTLTGAGGMGKTRLALRVAAERLDAHPDGVWIADLAPLAEPTLVVAAVAGALGLAEQTGRPLTRTLVEHLRPRELLLVLDNCEHLAGACAATLGELLPAAPGLRVLATSREALGVEGEIAWRVPSLPAPAPDAGSSLEELAGYESVQLFLERARAVRPDLRLGEADADALASVCARLDGVPLALELAAARVGVLSVGQIAARLDDCFRLLASRSRSGPARHQTLRATLDWSHDLLAPTEQALLRRLSAFAGGFSLEAAEVVGRGDEVIGPGAAVGPEDHAVLDLLGQLVAKSLVLMDVPPGGVARYRLLETIRQYAAEKLAASGEAALTSRRHRDFYLALAEGCEDEASFGAEGRPVLDRLEVEHDNFRAALEWSLREDPDGDAGLRLVHALYPLWNVRGHHREGRAWMEALLAASRSPSAMRSAVARRAGVLAWTEDLEAASRLFALALDLARRSGDRRHMGRALLSLGDLALLRGDLTQAAAHLEESHAIAVEVGDDLFVAESLLWLGWVALSQGRYAEARARAEECRARGGGWYFAVRSLNLLATVERDEGHYEAATRRFGECRERADAAGDRGLAVAAREGLASVAAAHGRRAEAGVLYEEARALAGRPPPLMHTGILGGLAELAVAAGDHGRARTLFDEELEGARQMGDLFELTSVLVQGGRVAAAGGDPSSARSRFSEAISLSHRTGMPLPLAAGLEGLAGLEVEGRPHRAAALLAAATSIREGLGTPLPPSARKAREADLEALRAALGDDGLADCWAKGASLTLWEAADLGEEAANPG